ncbi:MAG: carboxypeptidase regulatory-like domain-containing protein [Terriglobales bacterium]
MRGSPLCSRALVTALVAFAVVVTGWSQGGSASLNGRVTDPSGAAIPGARVTLLRPATQLSRAVTTNAQGGYEFPALPPGVYQVTVRAHGFATVINRNVTLLVNEPATLNVGLQVASSATTVEVQGAAAPLVNHTDASIGNAFTTTQIQELPIPDRNVVALMSLQPGVVYLGNQPGIAQSNYDTRSGAVNGVRSDQSNVTLDGVDVNDQTNAYAFTSVLNIPPDSLQEFRVTTADPETSSGHGAGAQVAMVTKSGTNSFHGSVYEYNRNTALSANDFFLKSAELESGQPNTPPALIRNLYGVTLGGPLVHNKLFFFGNYEGRQDREGEVVTQTVPTASLRAGDLKYLTASGATETLTPAQIAAMGTANGVPAAVAGVDPAALQMLNSYPLPNSNAVGDLLNTAGYVFSSPTPGGYDTYIARLDYDLSSTQTMFLRGETENFKVDQPQEFTGQPPTYTNLTDSRGLIFGWTSVVSANFINNFRYGFIRQGVGSEGSSFTPYVATRNLSFPNSQGNYSSSLIVPDNDFTDDISWIVGNHTIQFGASADRASDASISYDNSFSNASLNTGFLNTSGFAGRPASPYDPPNSSLPAVNSDFDNNYDWSLIDLLGAITEYNAVYNYGRNGSTLAAGSPIDRNFQINDYQFYGQDQWHVTPNLVLTYGLNYTLEQPPYEANGLQVTPCVATASGSCTALNLGDWMNQTGQLAAEGKPASDAGPVSFELGGPVNNAPGLWNWDYGDLAPRLGLAWSPDLGHGWLATILGGKNQLSIRGGYDLIYEHFGAGMVNTFNQDGAFGLSTNLTNPLGITIANAPRMTCLTCLPSAIQPAAPPGGFPQTPPPLFGNIAWGLDSAIKTPYVHEVDFSITRQFGTRQSLSVSYVGTFGRRLPMQEDLSMPGDLVDPKSKQDYFAAADRLSKLYDANTPVANVPNIPFWQDIFSTWKGLTQADVMNALGDSNPCTPGPADTSPLTATQAVYELWSCFVPNETSASILLDFPPSNGGIGLPAPTTGYYSFYHSQYSSLYAWNNIGTSNYNAMQATYQARLARELQTQINYTWSRSMDEASDAERISESPPGGGLGGAIINSWSPFQLYGQSDFNTTQQINANWVWQLPVGRGQWLGRRAPGWLNEVIGGWEFSGYWRWTGAFPVNAGNGFFFPTNWELTGNAMQIKDIPGMQTTMNPQGPDGSGPNMFANPSLALAAFRQDLPGEAGSRNVVEGDGFFGIDTGLDKSFAIGEGKAVQVGWQTFNATNSVRFDAQTASLALDSGNSFGNYTSTLTEPRFMQLFAKITF